MWLNSLIGLFVHAHPLRAFDGGVSYHETVCPLPCVFTVLMPLEA